MAAPRRGIRVLVADERPGMELARALAELPRVRVCAAAGTAAEVMEAAETEGPDCVLVDISLPRLGGLDLLRALRRLHAPLPVIAVAPCATRELAQSALAAGASAFLPREEASQSLRAALAEVLAGRPCAAGRIPRRPGAQAFSAISRSTAATSLSESGSVSGP